MKFSYAAIAAVLASVAYSQSLSDAVASIPSCGLTCLAPAIAGAGCGLADYACQCGTAKDAITKAATPCIVAKCSAPDALKVQSATTQICTIEAASGSSSSASGSDSSSSAASSTAAGTTSAPSSSSSSGSFISSATGSSIGSLTSAASSKASSASSKASSAGASATSSAPATVTSNAGNRVMAAGAVVGAGFLAAFAL